MKFILSLPLIFSISPVLGQATLSGFIKNKTDSAVVGANVYLQDTYDGGSANTLGKYQFKTSEAGHQILIVSAIGFETVELPIEIKEGYNHFNITLQESLQKMTGVTITAGSFEASDEKRGTVLRSLDIVTTPGALGDFTGAINTLPGAQIVGESGRLFIRGGEGYETKTFIDGIWVQNPYGATVPNVPTRGRFSPFLFKGTIFSSGGYSAEYGQALSSALILNSNDFPLKTQTDLSVMAVGASASHTQVWEKSSLSLSADYTNLDPLFTLVKQNFEWENSPKGLGASAIFRQKIRQNGMLKMFMNYNSQNFSLWQKNLDFENDQDKVALQNKYLYVNTSYKDAINKNWSVTTGFSLNLNKDETTINDFQQIKNHEKGIHFKSVVNGEISGSLSLKVGAEQYIRHFDRQLINNEAIFPAAFKEGLTAGFSEADFHLSPKILLRTGARLEYSDLIQKLAFNPRVSLAFQTGTFSQLSFASGIFHQIPQNEYLLFEPGLEFEKAGHYILNYQFQKDNRTLRVEGYYKNYLNLVSFHHSNNLSFENLENSGYGYAQGMEIWWRDRKSVKNLDYWISYSYIDTKRRYKDFPHFATPFFSSSHNFSAVGKYFYAAIRSQIGATYQFSEGRPYLNPNLAGFNQLKTKDFHSLNISLSFLYKPNIIIHTELTNVLGSENVFGYKYSSRPDETGNYREEAITPGAKRFFFIGLFITLSKDNTINQLDNL